MFCPAIITLCQSRIVKLSCKVSPPINWVWLLRSKLYVVNESDSDCFAFLQPSSGLFLSALLVVLPLESLAHGLFHELGGCLGGTCVGYALVIPTSYCRYWRDGWHRNIKMHTNLHRLQLKYAVAACKQHSFDVSGVASGMQQKSDQSTDSLSTHLHG